MRCVAEIYEDGMVDSGHVSDAENNNGCQCDSKPTRGHPLFSLK